MTSPSPEGLRRSVERRRSARRLLTGGVAVIVVLTAIVVTRVTRDDKPARLVVAPVPSTTVTPSATPSPSATPATPWLAGPWVLESSETSTWLAGRPGSYAFCGLRPYVPAAPFDVEEQRLTHPDGRRALLMRLISDEGAWQIWKWAYAECRLAGRSASDAAPRVLWSYGAVAAGLHVEGPHPLTAEAAADSDAYLVELTGPSAQKPATRSQVSEVMDSWVGPLLD
jgi:hypothetical protein